MNLANHRNAMLVLPKRLALIFVASAAIGFHSHAGAAEPANAGVLKFSPALTQSAVLARPDSDLVEFPNGKRVRVGELRRLDTWASKARSTPARPFPAALRTKPARTGQRVDDIAALSGALKQPDSTTLRLQTGRLATVGQIKFVLPKVEESVGHSLSVAPVRRNLSGPAVKVTAKSDWKDILKRPDGTVLEGPDGQRITVGELKQVLKTTRPASGTRTKTSAGAPAGATPSPASQQR
jgi:hypothetical protein